MRTFTIEDIRSWEPCYDPTRHLPEKWSGTALDILKNDEIPVNDRFWVVLRKDGPISDKTMRLFAVWCARQVEGLTKDNGSKNVLDVAERYTNGLANDAEWAAARAAAWDAASAAAWAAAWDAASAAAWAAARDAAWDAARDAAWAAARDAQLKRLIAMLEKGAE